VTTRRVRRSRGRPTQPSASRASAGECATPRSHEPPQPPRQCWSLPPQRACARTTACAARHTCTSTVVYVSRALARGGVEQLRLWHFHGAACGAAWPTAVCAQCHRVHSFTGALVSHVSACPRTPRTGRVRVMCNRSQATPWCCLLWIAAAGDVCRGRTHVSPCTHPPSCTHRCPSHAGTGCGSSVASRLKSRARGDTWGAVGAIKDAAHVRTISLRVYHRTGL
jgi:hypothetical protein